MHFNPWTFLFEVLNFVVLAVVLYRLLYRPLHEVIDRRREEVTRAQTEADKAREQAVMLQQQLHADLAEVEQRGEAALRQGRERAEAERKKMLDEADAEMQRRNEQARQALEREREEAWRSLRGEMTKLAVGVVQRLLRESCDRTLNDQLALHLIEELRQLSAESRQAVRDQWQPVDGAMLETAGELDEATRRRLTEAANELVGESITLATSTVPAISQQVPMEEELLPLDLSALERLSPPAGRRCFHYLPLPELLAGLLGQYAFISLYRMAAESYAGEQASRLIAMDRATHNTKRIGKGLLDLERRERQGEITRQVLELIGARFAVD
jgi:F-type H+-transporting ATPase subunit b